MAGETGNEDQHLSLLDQDARKLLMNTDAGPELYQARIRELVRRLLDLDSPRLTQHMLDFLLMDGIIEHMIRFLTRAPPTVPKLVEITSAYLLEALRPREREDVSLQKYAYNVSEVIGAVSPTTSRLLENKLREVSKFL
jgi:hypothetical protein